MKVKSPISMALGLLLLSGCYHQKVQTGLSPGPTVVKKPWTGTFLWGLVPAGAIDVTQNCPGGIATVETKMSFLNGLAAALTLGIYTPRDVSVTCAVAGAGMKGLQKFFVKRGTPGAEVERIFGAVIDESARSSKAVLIHFEQ